MTVTDASADQDKATHDVILDAAERLMGELGYDRTSIAAICRESGFPVGSIYHHFTNKAGLLGAVMDRWSARFFSELPAYAGGTGNPDDRFRNYWSAAVDAIVAQHPVLMLEAELMRLSHHDPDLHRIMTRVRAHSQRSMTPTFLAYARERGVADAPELAQRLAVLAESATRGLVLTCGPDQVAFRRAMTDLYEAVRSSIVTAASRPAVA